MLDPRRSALPVLLVLLAACGCGSGGSGPDAPTVTMSVHPVTVQPGEASSIAWSTTAADQCVAAGGWSGPRATNGTESTGPLTDTTAFTLTCTGRGGEASGSVSVAVAVDTPNPDAVFPLHVEAGSRHLLDAQGRPFFIHGDTPWSLIVQLTREEAAQYLDDRRRRQFNTVLVNLIEHHFANDPPRNAYGEAPFTASGDFSTPNEAYFAHAEQVISLAAERGMLVMLTPAYMGFEGAEEGWYQEMSRNGAQVLRAYGRYVANRFRAYDNILWVHGGDYDPPETILLDAIAEGIRDVDTRWLHTFHGSRGTAALEFLGNAASWLTVNNIYTDEHTVVAKALAEYERSQMPFFLIEAIYENEGADDAMVRTQAYQAVISGAGGHLMGNHPIWDLSSGWQQALSSTGARTLEHLRSLFESLHWWALVPDDGSLLTDGTGADLERAAFARTTDGSLALGYAPQVRPLTVNFGVMTGPNVSARWYDPTDGSQVTVDGSPFPASGSRTLTPPGPNSAGDSDWALVLQTQP